MSSLTLTLVIVTVLYSLLSYIIVGLVIIKALPQSPNWEWGKIEICLCLAVFLFSPIVLAVSFVFSLRRKFSRKNADGQAGV